MQRVDFHCCFIMNKKISGQAWKWLAKIREWLDGRTVDGSSDMARHELRIEGWTSKGRAGYELRRT
jgi:hypothetical protein